MNTRTNIVLDDELVAKAMALARVTTKKAAVEAALRAYVRKPDYSGLLALRGQGLIDPGYDPKSIDQPRYLVPLNPPASVSEPTPEWPMKAKTQLAKADLAKPAPAKSRRKKA